jgi:GT2 family glycosyltransferase
MVRAQFPQVKLLALDKDYGYSYGSNRGFEASSGEYILIMSSDIVFPTPTIAQLIEKMKSRPDVGILCPEFVDFNGTLKQLTWQWPTNLLGEAFNKTFSPTSLAKRPFLLRLVPFLQRKERHVTWVSGAAFVIRRDVMSAIKGFDEHFQLYYEDADLCDRVRQAGYKILFSPSIKAFHGLGESTKNEKSKTYLMFTQSRIYYYKKHRTRLEYHLLMWFLKSKFRRLAMYRKEKAYRDAVDYILDEKGTIQLWQDIQV